jgi:hypothetical protein
MGENKKPWFHRVSFRLWLPLSCEGWLLLAGLVAGMLLIPYLNGLDTRESLSLERHWPALVELGVLIIAFYWLAHGHVRK